MLNKGPHILEAVRVLDDILRRMEAHQPKKSPRLRKLRVLASSGRRQRQARPADPQAQPAVAPVAVSRLMSVPSKPPADGTRNRTTRRGAKTPRRRRQRPATALHPVASDQVSPPGGPHTLTSWPPRIRPGRFRSPGRGSSPALPQYRRRAGDSPISGRQARRSSERWQWCVHPFSRAFMNTLNAGLSGVPAH